MGHEASGISVQWYQPSNLFFLATELQSNPDIPVAAVRIASPVTMTSARR